MFTRTLPAAALALALLHAPANAEALSPETIAANACAGINEFGPVETVATVEDGLGDYVVWVKDKDEDLWLCNANSSGAVFTNMLMQGDLLSGDGGQLVQVQPVANRTNRGGGNPGQVAESLCATVGGYVEEMQVVVTVEDGLGDYMVWLKNANEELWLCNASGDAELFDFEPIDTPINGVVTEAPRFA